MRLNATDWTLWLILAMGYCALTYNPAYQLLLLASLSAVAISKRLPLAAYLKAGILMSSIPLLVNVFLVHYGKTTIFKVPYHVDIFQTSIPTLFFQGPITAESAGFGLIMVLFLANMLLAFQTFSSLCSPDSILRLIPSAISSVSLAVSIALRFIPQIMKDHAQIRDAQASRGLKVSAGSALARIRGQLGIIVPTVITSLERAFSLAESMASRGYTGRRSSYRSEVWGGGARLAAASYCIALAFAVYLKAAGVFDYWPYDRLDVGPLSAMAVMPLIALLIPLVTDDGCDKDR